MIRIVLILGSLYFLNGCKQKNHPDVSLYILDLRTLLPLDYEAIKIAVKATGKILLTRLS